MRRRDDALRAPAAPLHPRPALGRPAARPEHGAQAASGSCSRATCPARRTRRRGCVFRTRCPKAQDKCADEVPLPVELAPGHRGGLPLPRGATDHLSALAPRHRPRDGSRLLFVHAHPDDETLTTRHHAWPHHVAAGDEVHVLTCTLGEEGEVIPPELAHLGRRGRPAGRRSGARSCARRCAGSGCTTRCSGRTARRPALRATATPAWPGMPSAERPPRVRAAQTWGRRRRLVAEHIAPGASRRRRDLRRARRLRATPTTSAPTRSRWPPCAGSTPSARRPSSTPS